MQVFVTSDDPARCAKFLDDRRLNKSILESAQLLSNAIQLSGGPQILRPTHLNHPLTRWTMVLSHANWLYEYFHHALNQKAWRFNKPHSYERLRKPLFDGLKYISHSSTFVDFVNCTPYKQLPIFKAYHECLNDKWIKDFENGYSPRCSIGG